MAVRGFSETLRQKSIVFSFPGPRGNERQYETKWQARLHQWMLTAFSLTSPGATSGHILHRCIFCVQGFWQIVRDIFGKVHCCWLGRPTRSHLKRKCSKMSLLGGSWGPPGGIWWPRCKNYQHELSGGLLESFGGQGTKKLKMSLLGASWSHLVAKARKRSE